MQIARLLILTVIFSMVGFVDGKEPNKEGDKDFNPETILLGHFSFRPPSNWQWMHTDPGAGKIVTELSFHVAESTADDRHATVLMNLFKPNEDYAMPESVAKRWKSWFVEVQELPSQTVTYGEHKVTFIELAGSYHGPGSTSKKKRASPNYLLYGAVIEDSGGNVIGRFYGPAKLVEKYKAEFKKTIEDACKQD